MKRLCYALMFLASTLALTAAAAGEGQLNLDDDSLAIHGYDPVSYHLGEPQKGSEAITIAHKGAVYRFANEQNRETFRADPDGYLPAFGGWCAWAMLDGEKVDVDPETYKIVNGETYLYYNFFFTNTLTKWNELAEQKGEQALVKQAKAAWRAIVGS